MSNSVLSVDELRSRSEAVGVAPSGGSTAGYVRFDTDFALGSAEIAFGDDRAIYDESAFPGVVYPSEALAATLVVSGDGTVAVVDATETLTELGLVADDTPSETVVPADEILSMWSDGYLEQVFVTDTNALLPSLLTRFARCLRWGTLRYLFN